MFFSKITPKRSSSRRGRLESGFSLLELLVAMGIFAVIAAATVSIIVLLNNSAAKFQNTTTTQNELNTAMNKIQVDISQSTSLSTGSKNYIGLNSTQNNGTAYTTYIFYYDGTSNNIPDGANTSNLPPSTSTRGAIIEQVFQGTTFKAQTILVGNYQPSSSWKNFFQYYTANGTQYGKETGQLTADQLGSIVKVQFSLQSKVSDRTTPVELASAAAINSYVQGLSYTGNQPQTPNPTTLNAHMEYESTSTDGWAHAVLNWTVVPGAASYTVEREHSGVKDQPYVALDPNEVTWTDTSVQYGETYTYRIFVNGATGQSAQSNDRNLTVRPPKAVIVNVNTLKNLGDLKPSTAAETGDVAGYTVLPNTTYTVARNLTNQITWSPSNGAIGYKIYRGSTLVNTVSAPTTSYQDTGALVTYGAQNIYTVIPYNVGENNSGGNGVQADPATLVSPPTRPSISVNQSDASSGQAYNTISITSPGTSAAGDAYVKDNKLYANTSGRGTTVSCGGAYTGQTFARTGSVNHPVGFGTTSCYEVTAENDAGESPRSDPGYAYVRPQDFAITNINSTANLGDTGGNGERVTVARGLTNQVSWTGSNGASGYAVYANGNLITTITDPSVHYYQDGGHNYGDVTDYAVVAYTSWNDQNGSNVKRTTNATNNTVRLISPPVAPGISGSAYGSTTGNPYNTLTLSNTVANASGYNLYRNTNTDNDADCGNTSDTNQNFGTNQGSQINNGVDWGSSSCYVARAYNDAGFGPTSNSVKLYVGPSAFSVQNYSLTAGIDDQANGYYYSVARGLTNQVAWNGSNGADGYYVIRNGSGITTQGSGQRNYRDNNRSYGETETYYVIAYSSWGGTSETRQVNTNNSVYLISPPTSPNISAVANDTSSDSTFSDNTVNINSQGANATGTTVLGSSYQGTSSPNCSSTGNIGSSNGGSINDSTGGQRVRWGYGNCYTAYSYNYAGNGPTGNTDTALQLPGKFNVNVPSDSDLNNEANSMTRWFKLANNNTDGYDFQNYATKGYAGGSSNPNQDINYNISWGSSSGSKYYNQILGYLASNPGTSNTKESWANGSYAICSSSNSTVMNSQMPSGDVKQSTCLKNDSAASSATSISGYSDMSPGSYYRFVAIAVGQDGLRRGANATIITNPAEPGYVGSYIYERNSSSVCALRVASVGMNTAYGTATNVQGQVWFTGDGSPGYSTSSGSINSSINNFLGVYSRGKNPSSGDNTTKGLAKAYLSRAGGDYYSPTVGWGGQVPGTSCTVNSSTWHYLPESSYFFGHHSFYFSEDNSPSLSDTNDAPNAAKDNGDVQSWVNANLN